MLDSSQTVANLVLDHSECAQVFQRHRIDFCCRGEMSLAAAASSRNLPLPTLLDDLTAAISERSGDRSRDLRELSTPRLVAHIVAIHHEYLRKTLPFVVALAAKVSRVHGDKNPKLRDLHAAVDELSAVLLPHLDVEENELFPSLMVKQVNHVEAARALAEMLEEHRAVGALLERLRAAADDYVLPEWACTSYRTLFAELARVEGDVFTHVHLENHVLAPRFDASRAEPS
jgi:regulator of cell morphogenesis and NO signaling